MAREEEQKQKKKLELDWSVITPNEETEPAEVVVVSGQDFGDDHQLNQKIQRLRDQTSSPSFLSRLSDNGYKLRNCLKLCEEEQLRRRRMEAECEKRKQSKSSSFHGACKGFSTMAPSSQTQSKSEFATLFSQNLEDEQDLRTRISVDPVSQKVSLLGCRNKHNKCSDDPPLNKLRQSPTRCFGSSRHYGKEDRFPVGGTIALSNFYHSHNGGRSSNCWTKRIKASDIPASMQLKEQKKQCETVFLVDEEDCQPVENTYQENASAFLVDEEDCQPVENTYQENESAEWMKAKIYYPSRDDPESVELHYADIKCLAPKAFLSSTIMNFYIRYLQRPVSAIGKSRSAYHFFSTYFYGKVKEAVSCKRKERGTIFSKFRRWWKGVNIFEKAYILLPINENYHWSLVIICLPNMEESGPIILHLDSLGYHNSAGIFENVESFLIEEWNYLKQTGGPLNLPIADEIWRKLPIKIEHKKITVPQQKNEYDCGVFVLFFMERFLEQAPQRLVKQDLDMFGRQWFKPEEASRLRERIRKLLEEEFAKCTSENENIEISTTSTDDSAGSMEELADTGNFANCISAGSMKELADTGNFANCISANENIEISTTSTDDSAGSTKELADTGNFANCISANKNIEISTISTDDSAGSVEELADTGNY